MSQGENADRTQALVMPPAAGMQTAAHELSGWLFPTTQYYKIFLATVSAERSLWNGTIRSVSEVAAHPLNCQLTSRCWLFL